MLRNVTFFPSSKKNFVVKIQANDIQIEQDKIDNNQIELIRYKLIGGADNQLNQIILQINGVI